MKRFLQIATASALTFAALATAGCGQAYTARKGAKALERSVYIQDQRTSTCFLAYREPGEDRPDLSYVPCTPAVMTQINKDAAS